MFVAVDFDGTIVEHEFPQVGVPCPDSFKWMKKWQEAGAQLILWTMRSDDLGTDRHVLSDAIDCCRVNGVEFFAVNHNPSQASWTSSPKCYAHVYVDDAALGCPLIPGTRSKMMADWSKIGPKVLELIEQEKQGAKLNPHGSAT